MNRALQMVQHQLRTGIDVKNGGAFEAFKAAESELERLEEMDRAKKKANESRVA